MEGVDKEWMPNAGLQTVRYFLAPGTYTFQLYAARQFDAGAKPQRQIRLVIEPPFFKTWWFIGLLASGVLFLLVVFINQQNRRKYEKKLRDLEAEKKVKQERERLSKDLHDSLGAYANAVLYNVELLESEKDDAARQVLLGELRFASKDIITALRETVWALKKEQYTAEECLLRIRNFIQPLSRYFSRISFHITGDAPAGKRLHYTEALNLVRVVQEAVSNSIKHADALTIVVESVVEDGRWTLVVRDDGKGFDYGRAKKEEAGNGLGNMAYRASASGFRLTIKSGVAAGTEVAVAT
jgi:signal transduction histidine kinase